MKKKIYRKQLLKWIGNNIMILDCCNKEELAWQQVFLMKLIKELDELI